MATMTNISVRGSDIHGSGIDASALTAAWSARRIGNQRGALPLSLCEMRSQHDETQQTDTVPVPGVMAVRHILTRARECPSAAGRGGDLLRTRRSGMQPILIHGGIG